jgi:hypothetical protein
MRKFFPSYYLRRLPSALPSSPGTKPDTLYLDGKALPDGYVDMAKAIAERRVTLAGYRLADYLKAAF